MKKIAKKKRDERSEDKSVCFKSQGHPERKAHRLSAVAMFTLVLFRPGNGTGMWNLQSNVLRVNN